MLNQYSWNFEFKSMISISYFKKFKFPNLIFIISVLIQNETIIVINN